MQSEEFDFAQAWAKLSHKAYKNALDHGFHENNDYETIPVKLMLIVSEISEAMEAHRTGRYYADELADVVIRLLDLDGWVGLDIGKEVVHKMAHNTTRPYKHGGKAY